MPVAVRNNEPGPSVFSDTTKNIAVEWQAKGDPNGEDVQYVPDELIQTPQFIRAVSRGILSIEDELDPEIKRSFERQAKSYRTKEANSAKAAKDSIDGAANNDLIQVQCVGPNQRANGGTCGQPVPVKEKSVADRPPLCPQHTNLAPEYVPTETDEIRNGVPVKKWTRATLGTREQQQL